MLVLFVQPLHPVVLHCTINQSSIIIIIIISAALYYVVGLDNNNTARPALKDVFLLFVV